MGKLIMIKLLAGEVVSWYDPSPFVFTAESRSETVTSFIPSSFLSRTPLLFLSTNTKPVIDAALAKKAIKVMGRRRKCFIVFIFLKKEGDHKSCIQFRQQIPDREKIMVVSPFNRMGGAE